MAQTPKTSRLLLLLAGLLHDVGKIGQRAAAEPNIDKPESEAWLF